MLPAQPAVLISSFTPDSSNSLPKVLRTIFTCENIKSLGDAFVLALHSFMLETGFFPKDVPDQKHLEVLPKTWHENGVYRIRYYHSSCPEAYCVLTCVPLGPLISVFGTLEDVCEVQQSILPMQCNLSMRVSDYVKNGNGLSDPTKIYRNLKGLSVIFKDNIVFRLLARLQDAFGFGPTFGMSVLMDHLKMQILSYLPVESLVAMSAVNKEFQELCNSTSLWRNLLRNDFSRVSRNAGAETDWKERYKAEYAKPKLTPLPLTQCCHYSSVYSPFGFPKPDGSWYPQYNDSDVNISPFRGVGMPTEVRSAFPNFWPRISPSIRALPDLLSGRSLLDLNTSKF